MNYIDIKKYFKSDLEVAIKYFQITNHLNNFKWSPLDINLLAFLSSGETLSSGGKKEKFCSIFKVAKDSVYNASSKLIKRHFLVKEGGKIKINPQFLISAPLTLKICLNLNPVK